MPISTHILMYFAPYVWVCSSDFPLVNEIQHGLPLPQLNFKGLAFSCSFPLFHFSFWWSQLPCCKWYYGETYMVRNWRSLLANSQIHNPTFHKELNPANKEAGSGSHPSWTSRWLLSGDTLGCYLVTPPDPEDPAKPCPDSWPIETVSQ